MNHNYGKMQRSRKQNPQPAPMTADSMKHTKDKTVTETDQGYEINTQLITFKKEIKKNNPEASFWDEVTRLA